MLFRVYQRGEEVKNSKRRVSSSSTSLATVILPGTVTEATLEGRANAKQQIDKGGPSIKSNNDTFNMKNKINKRNHMYLNLEWSLHCSADFLFAI